MRIGTIIFNFRMVRFSYSGVKIEIYPVYVPAARIPGLTETVSVCAKVDRNPLVGVTESQFEVLAVFITANAVKEPLPLMVTCCAGGAALPGASTVKVRLPVPVEVVLIVRFTVNEADGPSFVWTVITPEKVPRVDPRAAGLTETCIWVNTDPDEDVVPLTSNHAWLEKAV